MQPVLRLLLRLCCEAVPQSRNVLMQRKIDRRGPLDTGQELGNDEQKIGLPAELLRGKGLVRWWDWIFAILYIGFTGIIMQLIGFRLLASTASPYPFTPDEMNRLERERRLRRVGINSLSSQL